ncbi:hypothetical protein BGZ57DRAFT_908657 [Hyaloscypha finlandica]|nr:hypothetical protein BGZ57DRAFT_908657 [Hyaloscypha finlandica]
MAMCTMLIWHLQLESAARPVCPDSHLSRVGAKRPRTSKLVAVRSLMADARINCGLTDSERTPDQCQRLTFFLLPFQTQRQRNG